MKSSLHMAFRNQGLVEFFFWELKAKQSRTSNKPLRFIHIVPTWPVKYFSSSFSVIFGCLYTGSGLVLLHYSPNSHTRRTKHINWLTIWVIFSRISHFQPLVYLNLGKDSSKWYKMFTQICGLKNSTGILMVPIEASTV